MREAPARGAAMWRGCAGITSRRGRTAPVLGWRRVRQSGTDAWRRARLPLPAGLIARSLLPTHQGPLPEREAAGVARALLELVAYAHELGVTHRDIKVGRRKARPRAARRPPAAWAQDTHACERAFAHGPGSAAALYPASDAPLVPLSLLPPPAGQPAVGGRVPGRRRAAADRLGLQRVGAAGRRREAGWALRHQLLHRTGEPRGGGSQGRGRVCSNCQRGPQPGVNGGAVWHEAAMGRGRWPAGRRPADRAVSLNESIAPNTAQEVLGGVYDERADVWSCGVVLYVLLCGRPPFSGSRTEAIFRRILDDGVPDM